MKTTKVFLRSNLHVVIVTVSLVGGLSLPSPGSADQSWSDCEKVKARESRILCELELLKTQLDDQKEQLNSIEAGVATADAPIERWTSRFCVSINTGLGVGYQEGASLKEDAAGGIGAYFLGDGVYAKLNLEGNDQIKTLAIDGGVSLSLTVCRPPDFFDSQTADASGSDLAAQINKAETTLGFSDNKVSQALAALTGYEFEDKLAAASATEAAAAQNIVDALPGGAGMKNAVLSGPQMAKDFVARKQDICNDSTLPPEFKAAIEDVCKLGQNKRGKALFETVAVQTDKIHYWVSTIHSWTSDVHEWVAWLRNQSPW